MTPALSLLAAVLTGLATSCMVGPNYDTPKAKVTDQWLENPAITNRPDSLAEVYWWRNFEDPVLNGLIDRAHRNNLSLQIAGLRILQARAALNKSIGNLFPQQQGIAGQVDYARLKDNLIAGIPGLSSEFVSANMLFAATWETDLWGKYRRGIQTDQASFLGSVATYDDALVTLIADVASSYVNIRTLEER